MNEAVVSSLVDSSAHDSVMMTAGSADVTADSPSFSVCGDVMGDGKFDCFSNSFMIQLLKGLGLVCCWVGTVLLNKLF